MGLASFLGVPYLRYLLYMGAPISGVPDGCKKYVYLYSRIFDHNPCVVRSSVLSCVVLSCPVLSSPVVMTTVPSLVPCPVPSCPVLSSPVPGPCVLSCRLSPVLCHVLFCLVLSCPVLSCPVLSCPVLSYRQSPTQRETTTQPTKPCPIQRVRRCGSLPLKCKFQKCEL